MRASLCYMKYSHGYQMTMKRSLLQITDSLNRGGKEQLTDTPTAQKVPELTSTRWSIG